MYERPCNLWLYYTPFVNTVLINTYIAKKISISSLTKLMYIVYTMYIMTTLSATEARNRFFELLNLVGYKGEEFVIEKDGKPLVKMSPTEEKKSTEEIQKIVTRVRRVFAKSPKRKYWSVLDTPGWKKKEKKYLENISKGILRGQTHS